MEKTSETGRKTGKIHEKHVPDDAVFPDIATFLRPRFSETGEKNEKNRRSALKYCFYEVRLWQTGCGCPERGPREDFDCQKQ